MYRYFWISLVIILGWGPSLWAQNNNVENTSDVTTIEKEKASLKPYAARVGANIFRLGRSVFDNNYSSWDISGDVAFSKYFIEVTYGREQNTLSTDDFDYQNSGSFFRIGPEANFVKDQESGNAFVFGLKYVLGSYDETFTFEQEDAIFGNQNVDLNNESLNSSWLEMNVGLKAKIWRQLYAGFYFRYKFANSVRGDREFATFQIPGFGLEDRSTIVGFDYYLYWRIPFKKSPKLFLEE